MNLSKKRFCRLVLMLILFLLCFLTDSAYSGENSNTEDDSLSDRTEELSFVQIVIIAKKIVDISDLEGFYLAEELALHFCDNIFLKALLKKLKETTKEPLVKSRLTRISKIISNNPLEEFPDRRIYSLYFSSDAKRRNQVIEELWMLGSPSARDYLLEYLGATLYLNLSYELKPRLLL